MAVSPTAAAAATASSLRADKHERALRDPPRNPPLNLSQPGRLCLYELLF